MARKIFFALSIAIVLLVFLSGCTTLPVTLPTCGNGTVELGEQCDGEAGDCSEAQVCLNDCTCGIPSPPELPA